MTYLEGESQQAVNDILLSIREKMIAGDIPEKSRNLSPIELTSSVEQRSGDDILDLTRLIRKDGSIVDLGEYPSPVAANSHHFKKDINSSLKKNLAEDNKSAQKEEEKKERTDEKGNVGFQSVQGATRFDKLASYDSLSQEKLLSEEALQQSALAFAELARLRQKPALPTKPFKIESAGEYTLDTLMRELLHPLLKEWLDAHLPSIIKTLVAEQIEKTLQQRHEPHS